jgi:hypothetical protein
MKVIVAFLVAIVLAACGSISRGKDDAGVSADTCRAADYSGFVGTPLVASTFPAGVRVIWPDTVITYDFLPARLNVLVDAAGNISGLRCG